MNVPGKTGAKFPVQVEYKLSMPAGETLYFSIANELPTNPLTRDIRGDTYSDATPDEACDFLDKLPQQNLQWAVVGDTFALNYAYALRLYKGRSAGIELDLLTEFGGRTIRYLPVPQIELQEAVWSNLRVGDQVEMSVHLYCADRQITKVLNIESANVQLVVVVKPPNSSTLPPVELQLAEDGELTFTGNWRITTSGSHEIHVEVRHSQTGITLARSEPVYLSP